MTQQQKLQEVREVIVAAVPELGKCTKSLVYCGNLGCKDIDHMRPIGLEDVLRAIRAKHPIDKSCTSCHGTGSYLQNKGMCGGCEVCGDREEEMIDCPDCRLTNAQYEYELLEKWTLGLPLDQQPEAVIDFLYSILVENV